jgi:hypothetical protein
MSQSPATSEDAPLTHESFLVLGRFRYLKLALLLCILSIAAYIWDNPKGGPSGGTALGYTLGTIGALLIVWLTWLGVRKRRYASNLGTVKGWTSAHVYLGLSLIVIATLHTAFQFGWNVHTLAYVLMCGVIASGIYGIVAYSSYPSRITTNRASGTRDAWLAELEELNEQSIKIADTIGPEVHKVVVRSVEGARIGGSIFEQLFGTHLKKQAGLFESIRENLDTRLTTAISAPAKKTNLMATEVFMAGQLAGAERSVQEAERIRKLLDLLARRRDLVARINRDIRLNARMQVWLYVHVPLTLGLLAALVAHIVSVFLYW